MAGGRSDPDRVAVLEGGEERLDRHVLGQPTVAEDQVGNRLDLAAVRLEELGERAHPAFSECLNGHRSSSLRPSARDVAE